MSRAAWVCGVLACGTLIPLLARAEPSEDFSTTYYDVKARAGQSLSDAIQASSPITSTTASGRRFHGYTKWYIKWNWRHRFDADGRCRITSVQVDLTGNILLPRLKGGSSTQIATFDRYLAALREHEEGHQRIAQEAAQDIERTLLALRQFPHCKALEAEANALARARLDAHLERERAYDRDTGHGRTQGAVLTD